MPVAKVVSESSSASRAGRRRVLQSAAAACLVAAASSGSLAQPRLPPLTLKLVHTTRTGIVTVDHDAPSLLALGSVQITTSVPWNREPHRWAGVSIRRLVESVEGTGRPVRLKALNDYEARIFWNDLERYDPILAWFADDLPIPVRSKGPLLVIYPFDANPALRRAEYTDRSVWHVNEITVE